MTDPPTEKVRELPAIRAVPISDIRESDSNPRVISDRAVEMVVASLRRFGWKQPIVVDGDGDIIVGHTRHRAARSLGLTHVPVLDASDLSPEEAAAYRIVDNRTRDYTTWDLPDLAQQLEALSGDFSDVLGLSDWEAVMGEYDAAVKAAADLNDIDLPSDVADAIDGGFILTVHFHDKQQALEAQQVIMDLPGVFDVRHDY